MKLTKAIKETIINAAANEAYDKKIASAKAILTQEVISKFDDWKILNKELTPSMYYDYMNWTSEVYLWQRYKANISISLPFQVCVPSSQYYLGRNTEDGYSTDASIAYNNSLAAKEAFRKELTDTIVGINTSKQLEDNIPILTKYLPPAVSTNYPIPLQKLNHITDILKGAQE